jgi:hypothetical protein
MIVGEVRQEEWLDLLIALNSGLPALSADTQDLGGSRPGYDGHEGGTRLRLSTPAPAQTGRCR